MAAPDTAKAVLVASPIHFLWDLQLPTLSCFKTTALMAFAILNFAGMSGLGTYIISPAQLRFTSSTCRDISFAGRHCWSAFRRCATNTYTRTMTAYFTRFRTGLALISRLELMREAGRAISRPWWWWYAILPALLPSARLGTPAGFAIIYLYFNYHPAIELTIVRTRFDEARQSRAPLHVTIWAPRLRLMPPCHGRWWALSMRDVAPIRGIYYFARLD